nr:hypothetical protein CFP56_48547 [Quercus suber]
MVVNATDFDGSFLRKVAKLVSEKIEENSEALKQGKSGNLPRMVMVVTKIDLLPTELSPTRQKSAASQAVSPAATPEQLRQSHSAAASAGADSAEPEGSNSHQGIKPRATEIKQFKICSSLSKRQCSLANTYHHEVDEGRAKALHISKELRPQTYRIKRCSIGCYLELQFGVALPTYW